MPVRGGKEGTPNAKPGDDIIDWVIYVKFVLVKKHLIFEQSSPSLISKSLI